MIAKSIMGLVSLLLMLSLGFHIHFASLGLFFLDQTENDFFLSFQLLQLFLDVILHIFQGLVLFFLFGEGGLFPGNGLHYSKFI